MLKVLLVRLSEIVILILLVMMVVVIFGIGFVIRKGCCVFDV